MASLECTDRFVKSSEFGRCPFSQPFQQRNHKGMTMPLFVSFVTALLKGAEKDPNLAAIRHDSTTRVDIEHNHVT